MRDVALCQRPCAGAADHRRVVRARHRHRQHLRRAVCRTHRGAVGVSLTAHELVVRRAHRVGPHTPCRDAECAVAVAPCHARVRHKQVVRAVHVRARQGPRGALRDVALCQRPCAGPADHRRIVGASDRDPDGLLGAVCRTHSYAVGVNLPVHELVVRRVHRVGPHTPCRDA